ncbi:MAG: T9SS C-terminal target domain-containing protein [Cyclobacteriaceae bacterium]|nr:T9SS C-terminal target domain-containing protein [Cyclobacteriaceae bacterium]
MKYSIFLLVFIVSLTARSQNTEYTMTGEYQGKNVYVQNPLSRDKINFCASEVYLNEQLINTSPKTSAFEIDLSNLAVGASVFIKIVHKEGCVPKIINPQVIRSKSKFQFLIVNADAQSISWSTMGELPFGKFFLEQYRNKAWVNISTISGKGSFESNQYSLPPAHHSGDNKYRLKHVQNDGKIFFSPVFNYFSDVDPVSFFPTMVVDKITLSRESEYKVVDSFGNQITQGKGKEIDLQRLKAGLYFLYVDNREERFVKK